MPSIWHDGTLIAQIDSKKVFNFLLIIEPAGANKPERSFCIYGQGWNGARRSIVALLVKVRPWERIP
jgi:hypothetical protein